MRRILTVLVAAGSIGVAAITTSSSAQAWWGWGPAVAGGVVAGAIVGGAIGRDRIITPTTDRIPITDHAVASGTVTPGYPPAKALTA